MNRKPLLALLLAALSASPAFAQSSNIDTTPSWNGTNFISSWGVPNTATYGQTITPTANQNFLGSFTFYLQQQTGTAPQYQAFVYEWNPDTSRIVGPALYTSAVATAPSSTTAYTAVTINTGGTRLTAGKVYVLFLSTSTVTGQANTTYRYGSVANNATYAGGQFVFFNNGTNFDQLSTGTWSTIAQDLAMIINFSSPIAYSVNLVGYKPAMQAANSLDVLVGGNSTNPDVTIVANAFGNLTAPQSITNAVTQTLPLMTAGMNNITFNAMRDVNRVVQARVDGETGISAGDAFQGDRSAWMKPYGSVADQDSREGVAGYRSRNYGIAFGADRALSARSRVGIGAAFGSVQVNSRSEVANNNASIRAYTLLGYGYHSLTDSVALTWQLDAGVTDNSGRRMIDFGGLNRIATSNYKAYTAHAGAALSRSYSVGANTTIAPAIRADYSYIRSRGYQEDGAGALNLAVDANRGEEFVLGAEGRLAHKLNSQSTVTANLGIGYDTLNKRSSITASYVGGGPAFYTEGMRASPWIVRGGVGMNFYQVKKAQIAVRYDFEMREDFSNQTASVNVRVPF